MMGNRFLANVTITGKIECLTGLHIGGVGVGYEIGGIDNIIVRDPFTGFPYIPGSSLKGKMRSIMEWAERKVLPDGGIHFCRPADLNCSVCRIFGTSPQRDGSDSSKQWQGGPTRLIVRDAHPDKATREKMVQLEKEQGLPKVEIKTENNINRITSATISGPRSQERIPVGSKFNFEFQYSLYEVEGCTVSDLDLLPKVFEAMRLLEDSALGGGGTRGSGQIKFRIAPQPAMKTVEDYQKGTLPPPPDYKDLVELAQVDVTSFKEKIAGKIK